MSVFSPYTTAGSVVGTKTVTATPSALFAGASVLADRQRLKITNLSEDTRLRLGFAESDLQRDGQPLEPGDTATLYPDNTTIYGASEGRPVKLQIEERD